MGHHRPRAGASPGDVLALLLRRRAGVGVPAAAIIEPAREELVELATVWVGAGHVAGSAATIALVSPVLDDAREAGLAQYDLGQVTMSIMIAAAGLGIGSGHSAAGDQDP